MKNFGEFVFHNRGLLSIDRPLQLSSTQLMHFLSFLLKYLLLFVVYDWFQLLYAHLINEVQLKEFIVFMLLRCKLGRRNQVHHNKQLTCISLSSIINVFNFNIGNMDYIKSHLLQNAEMFRLKVHSTFPKEHWCILKFKHSATLYNKPMGHNALTYLWFAVPPPAFALHIYDDFIFVAKCTQKRK